MKKRGREGFCFRVNAALTTRPAGYTCGRLPYLLRPSNKPQTSSRGKGWRGKEYSREILSLVNGRGFSKVGEGEFCANFVFYGIAAASHTCTCSCTRVRLFFSVRCNDNVREGGGKDRRVKVNPGPLPWSDRDPGTIDFSPEIYPENEISGLPSLRPSCIYSLSNR